MHRPTRTPVLLAPLVAVSGLCAACGLFGRSATPPERGGDASGSGEAPSVSTLPEAEPNDALERANRLPVGRPFAGRVDPNDLDVVSLPPADGAIDLMVTAGASLQLEVARPQDAASYVIPIAGGEPVTLVGISREATLALTLRGTGDYTLTATPSDVATCGFGFEPDDAASPSARAGSVPATLSGCLATPNDVDTFLVPAAALTEISGFGLTLSGVPGVSLSVSLRTSSGDLLAELAGADGEELAFPNLRAPPDGDVFVEIRSLAGASESSPYRVSLRRLPPLNGVVELEPNDDAGSATALSEIGLVNGYLHRLGDQDHFTLTTETPLVLRMLAEPPATVDVQVALTTAGAVPLVVDTGRVGAQERICSLRVGPDAPVSFVVSARAQERTRLEPYLLHFELFEGLGWETEPNEDVRALLDAAAGDPRSASEVGIRLPDGTLSGVAQGYAFPPGDVDRFLVRITSDPTAEATYKSITLRLEPNGPSDYALELFDDEAAAVGTSSSGRLGESETLAVDLPAGLYVAQVTLLAGEPCAQPYRLTVTQTEATVPSIFEGSGGALALPPIERMVRVPEGSGDVPPIRREPPPRPEDTLPDVDPELQPGPTGGIDPLQPRTHPELPQLPEHVPTW